MIYRETDYLAHYGVKAMNFAAKFGAQALRYSAAIDRGQVLLDSYNLGEAYASGVRKKK